MLASATMGNREKLSKGEIQDRLVPLPAWEVAGDKLRREFLFRDFVEAFAFMTSLALFAEELDHHPEWSNVYNRVVIELQTHDAGGLTALDFEFAAAADRLWEGNDQ